MMTKWWIIVKTLVKSSLDNYVLPGTLAGTEILLVYLYQWKRDISLLAAASFYLLNSANRADLDKTLMVGAPEDTTTQEEAGC